MYDCRHALDNANGHLDIDGGCLGGSQGTAICEYHNPDLGLALRGRGGCVHRTCTVSVPFVLFEARLEDGEKVHVV